MITITQTALPHLRRALGNKQYLLFGATGGGCNGFEYVLNPTNSLTKGDHVLEEEVGVPIVVCGRSGYLVVGTEISWKEDVMGKRFDFMNPTATGTCGCGATFSFE